MKKLDSLGVPEAAAKEQANLIVSLLKHCISVFKSSNDVSFTMNGTEPFIDVYIKGNKTAGEDFYVNGWKTIPVLKVGMHKNGPMHPSHPHLYWLDLRTYTPSNSSEYWIKSESELIEQINEALQRATDDFIEKEL